MNYKRLFLSLATTLLSFTTWATPFSVQAASPTATTPGCAEGAGVWIGAFGSGANCMDTTGWQAYTAKSKAITSDQVQDIEICGDRVVVAHTLGLSTRNNKGKWKTDRFKSGISSPSAIDCDAKGNIWLAHFDGVSRYDGKTWRTFGKKEGLLGDNVYAITISPNGDIWAGTKGGVARIGLGSAKK